jgi:hypothetical protein
MTKCRNMPTRDCLQAHNGPCEPDKCARYDISLEEAQAVWAPEIAEAARQLRPEGQ